MPARTGYCGALGHGADTIGAVVNTAATMLASILVVTLTGRMFVA